ncbi:MAG: pilus assembly protein PilM [Verrucomicrobiota bacterium]
MNKTNNWAAIVFSDAALDVKTTREVSATEPLPEGGDRLQIAAQIIRQRVDLRDHHIVTAIPCEDVLCQTLRLPTIEAGELKQMLDLQIDNLTPLPLEEVVYSFEPLDATANETRVLVAVARKSAVNERIAALEAAGWPAEIVGIDALAVFRQLSRQGVLPADAKLNTLVLVGLTAANIIVYSAGKIVAIRSVMLGGHGVDETVFREELHRTLVATEVERAASETGRTTFATWNETVRPQLAALAQTWGGETEFLTNGTSPSPAASVCLETAAAGPTQLNLLPEEWRERRKKAGLRSLLVRGAIGLAALYVLAVLSFLTFMAIRQAQLSRLQSEIKKLEPQFTKARELNRTLITMQKQLDTKYSVLEVLREVTQLLPENVKFNGFSFKKDETVVVRGQAQSAGFATDYISRLEHSPMFAKVVPGNMRSEPGSGLTKFDVTCTLKSSANGN